MKLPYGLFHVMCTQSGHWKANFSLQKSRSVLPSNSCLDRCLLVNRMLTSGSPKTYLRVVEGHLDSARTKSAQVSMLSGFWPSPSCQNHWASCYTYLYKIHRDKPKKIAVPRELFEILSQSDPLPLMHRRLVNIQPGRTNGHILTATNIAQWLVLSFLIQKTWIQVSTQLQSWLTAQSYVCLLRS